MTVTQDTLTPEQRRAALANSITFYVNNGWRMESQTEFQAVMVKGHRPNHILHLILTIITLGFWVFVWAGVALLGGERRTVLNIDEYGNLIKR